MTGMEKVITKFENYLSRVGAYRKDCSKGCDACMLLHPDDGYCDIQLLDNVLSMLKEQKAKQVNISQTHCGMKYGLCPRCEKQIDTLVNPHYCGNCGQELKWE